MAMIAQADEQFWPRLAKPELWASRRFLHQSWSHHKMVFYGSLTFGVSPLRLNTRASHGRRRRSSSLPVCE
jgi:hypothetical protein